MLDSAAVQRNAKPDAPTTTSVQSLTSSRSPSGKLVTAAWVALILAALYICYFRDLGALGFVGPDEPRYAWVAREMLETHDWVTPRLYGQPWFEKPVLYYWGAALCFKLLGVSETAARLPSAISALFATLGLAWLAWRIYGVETARFLLVVLPTTAAMIGFSRAAAPDMPFAAMLTLAMVSAAVVVGLAQHPQASASQVRVSRVSLAGLVAFGFFIGAAVLAKGPAAIILAGGATLLWALATKRWRDALRLAHPIAIAAFCATALPWYLLCARRNPEFLRIFILEHNFARFLTPVFQHVQSFWFFVPVILLGILPWTAVLAVITRHILRVDSAKTIFRSPLWFSGCWALVPIIFFSLSKSKLPGYVLPSFPPLILLFARELVPAKLGRPRGARWLVFAQAALFLGIGIAAAALQGRIPGGTGGAGISKIYFICAAIAGGLIIAALEIWRRASLGVLPSAVVFLSLIIVLGGLLKVLDPIYFSRQTAKLAFTIHPELGPQNASVYQIQRAQHYSLNFYLHRELPEWKREQKTPALVFTQWRERPGLEHLGLSCTGPSYAVATSLVVCKMP